MRGKSLPVYTLVEDEPRRTVGAANSAEFEAEELLEAERYAVDALLRNIRVQESQGAVGAHDADCMWVILRTLRRLQGE